MLPVDFPRSSGLRKKKATQEEKKKFKGAPRYSIHSGSVRSAQFGTH